MRGGGSRSWPPCWRRHRGRSGSSSPLSRSCWPPWPWARRSRSASRTPGSTSGGVSTPLYPEERKMIEVILREEVKSLGKAGALVRVKPGYARNYLLPRGLAYEATEGNKKRIAAETRSREARASQDRTEAQAAADRLAQGSGTPPAQGGGGGAPVRAVPH